MVKKESGERGMTRADIEKHLAGKSDQQQITYLSRILTKESLLEPETRMRSYAILGRSYENVGNMKDASKMYRAGGDDYNATRLIQATMAKRGYTRDSYRAGKALLASLGLFSGIFFLSNNITGNAISNLTQTNSNFIGIFLFCVGLVATFFLVRK